MANSLKVTKPATREEWLQRFVEQARPYFKQHGVPLPKKVRCSVGFASKGARSSTIGECWFASVSEDKVSEIFIVPSLQDNASRIADVLTHELCHAALPEGSGHGKEFRHLATALGLTGKMTATVAGPAWHAWADPIVKQLGKFPGAKLGAAQLEGGKKKQTTRMIKVACKHCGWSFRTSQQNIDAMKHNDCLSCNAGGALHAQ